MCGIAGIVSFNGNIAPALIKGMTDLIRHRGPDDEGFLAVAEIQGSQSFHLLTGPDSRVEGQRIEEFNLPSKLLLGHRRLSILDLSPLGRQPMSNRGGKLWIVYNGEIYNYLELRKELEGLGRRFISHSDTEVILAAYAQWGRNSLHRFNGMFAFILVDRERNELFLARDRFGVKPLYYWVSPHGFIAFASEIKQFTVLPGWQAVMNGQRVYDFLNWELIDHTRETLFKGVYQLRGGEALHCNLRDISASIPVYRWYNLTPRPFEGGMEKAASEFKDLLEDSIRLRLRADVEVGSCLSGGLDSSSIVCIVNDLLRKQNAAHLQKTFSACATVKRFDEKAYIDEVVQKTKVDAYYTYPEMETLFDTLGQIAWHQDEPFGSTSIYAQWHVFKLASEHAVKVMLDGQGADEQLAGYHDFFAPRFSGLFKNLHWIQLWREVQRTGKIHGHSILYAVKGIANMLLPEPIRQPMRKLAGKAYTRPEWLSLEKLGAKPLDLAVQLKRKTDTIQQLSYSQITVSNLSMLLHWEDRSSMAHSIEARVPFLDCRLVEFLLGLPDEYKLSEGVTKRVLREAMTGLLPEMVRSRMDKMGFVTPEEVWIKERNPELFRKKIQEAVEVSHGVLTPAAIQRFEAILQGKNAFSFYPWRLISFGNWIKQFNVYL